MFENSCSSRTYKGGGALGGKATPGGTGLGLSICRRIAEAMGGTVTLRNREYVGAVAALEVEFAFSAVPPRFKTANAQIYLAVDDVDTAKNLRDYLVALGAGARLRSGRRPVTAAHDDEQCIVFVMDEWSDAISVSRWDIPGSVRIDAYPLSWRDVLRVTAENWEQETQSNDWQEAERSGLLRVLVAEDHRISRQLLVRQLESFGCDVTACEDGLEAWNALQSDQSYSLLITDGHMPRMDGLSLCRRLRRDDAAPQMRRLPVLIMSATPLDIPEELMNAPGRMLVLLKPLKLRALHKAIARVVSKNLLTMASPQKAVSEVPKTEQKKSMLEQFADAVATDQQKLVELIGAADIAGIKFQIHRQAGALAAMGLTSLADQAIELERELESLPCSDALAVTEAFNRELSKAIEKIRNP
ncbi:hypothetical protein DDE05_40475 [Streptomyces cavourensis]|nr:hypothetical protein DDE05_40475 [Streptomyces cavourensis]